MALEAIYMENFARLENDKLRLIAHAEEDEGKTEPQHISKFSTIFFVC